LAITSGLGPDNPGSNPGSPVEHSEMGLDGSRTQVRIPGSPVENHNVFKQALSFVIREDFGFKMAAERFSAKRYGVRYGRKLRDKIGSLDNEKRSNICPYCHYKKVDRLSAGIWLCRKCDSKFTGRAYTVGKKVEETVVEEAEPIAKEPATETEETATAKATP
tara:strand:- start:1376 stop:1864 length:489 start_codon:yes stop_codon:yes gene_type:complete